MIQVLLVGKLQKCIFSYMWYNPKQVVFWMQQLRKSRSTCMCSADLSWLLYISVTVFYNGSLGQDVIRTVASAGGQMTEQDLATYHAVTRPVQTTVFADFNILVPGVPSGGPALLEALKLLPDINSTTSGRGMSPSYLVSLANASESVYRKAFLGIWGNSSEKVLLFYVCRLSGLHSECCWDSGPNLGLHMVW